jgi:hypothetical protein
MKQYDDTNSGVLFKNKEQREGHKDPNMQGRINIDGTDYWLSAWTRTPNAGGDQFLSLAVGDPVQPANHQAPPRQQNKPAAPAADNDFVDDDIPF